MTPKQIKGLSIEELTSLCMDNKFPEFRAKQIYQWMYRHGVTDVESMNNIPNDIKYKILKSLVLGALSLFLHNLTLNP